MATATPYVQKAPEKVIVSFIDEDNSSFVPHSGWIEENDIINMMNETTPYLSKIESNIKYIKLLSSINHQYNTLDVYYNNYSFDEINNIFSQSCSSLLELIPDKMHVELTNNNSMVFTIKKGDYTFFFERFINYDSPDEVIYSAYNKRKKYPSFAGIFQLAINSLIKDFFPYHKIYILSLPQ